MKPRGSSLNPYAASYIPLAKREANHNPTAKDVEHGDETASSWFEPSSDYAQNPHYVNASLDSVTGGSGNHQVADAYALKTHPAHGSLIQNAGEMTGKQIMDEVFDMDFEYLRRAFPGLSDESLLDVYLANNGDLEATVDMLNQLEMHTVESSGTLPDTLDIGDVSDSGSSAIHDALKLKNVAGETRSSSSSGSAQIRLLPPD